MILFAKKIVVCTKVRTCLRREPTSKRKGRAEVTTNFFSKKFLSSLPDVKQKDILTKSVLHALFWLVEIW